MNELHAHIDDRASFFRVLDETLAMNMGFRKTLERIKEWTASGRTPTLEERKSVNLTGGLGHNYDSMPAELQAFADRISELAYYFRWWPSERLVRRHGFRPHARLHARTFLEIGKVVLFALRVTRHATRGDDRATVGERHFLDRRIRMQVHVSIAGTHWPFTHVVVASHGTSTHESWSLIGRTSARCCT